MKQESDISFWRSRVHSCWLCTLVALSFLFLLSFPVLAQDSTIPKSDELKPTALDIWNQMVEQSFIRGNEPIKVSGTSGKITFGAEKEGSSGLITRVMGPKALVFRELLRRFDGQNGDNKEVFLREFLSQFVSGQSRQKQVIDFEGKPITLDLTDLKGVDYSKISLPELEEKFNVWLDRAGDSSFSFLKPSVRMQLFKGTFPGMVPQIKLDARYRDNNYSIGEYRHWTPLYGPAQKYIQDAHNTGKGWEINFKPQASYGEFETMIDWFRDSLRNAGEDFEAPGHQQLVYPKRTLTPEEQNIQARNLGELYRNIQAYIVLKGLLGKTAIDVSGYKAITLDKILFAPEHQTGRGVIRLENNRFTNEDGQPTLSIELRSGTKSDPTRRLVEQVVASRYAADDYSGLITQFNWELIPYKTVLSLTAESLVNRFGVSRLEARLAIQHLTKIQSNSRHANPNFLVPFWNWEHSPYLSKTKKDFLKDLTKTFIKKASTWKSHSYQDQQQALASWVQASGLVETLESYLIPKPLAPEVAKESQTFHRARSELPESIDVNKIDLGIEYTGRFPVKVSATYDRDPSHPKRSWIRTQYDLNSKEREQLLRQVGEELSRGISGNLKPTLVPLEEGSHGHSLHLAFELKDAQGRKWRIEWDGVGRDYDKDGKVIPDSVRGGHVEIVTPKFTPSTQDISAVYSALKSSGLIPDHRSGGGHINIDLAPFENNPKAMARFIAKFLEHRGMISLMFQDPRRVRTGEPNEVSPELLNALRDFNGTEQELKQLLYNERFFNSRLGRKTQYVQLNLNAYFQDVIPTEFLNKDFDLKNDPWRENFAVDPNIRKAEIRLFNAPESIAEAQAQIKLVRSLLDAALNDPSKPSGQVQEVQHERYVNNPTLAKQDFEKIMKDLGLDPKEYETYFWDGMQTTREAMETEGYLPSADFLQMFPKQNNWGKAVAARPKTEGIHAETRAWDPERITEAAKEYQEARTHLRKIEEIKRSAIPTTKGELSRATSKLPMELSLSEKEIELLPTHAQLYALYIKSRSPLSTPKDKKYVERKLNRLRKQQDFARSITESLQEAVGSGNRAFPLWLSQFVNGNPKFYRAAAALLSSAEPQVREVALKLIHRFKPEQLGKFLQETVETLWNSKAFNHEDVGLFLVDRINRLSPKLLEKHQSTLASVFNGLASLESPFTVKRKAFGMLSRLSGSESARFFISQGLAAKTPAQSEYYWKLLRQKPDFETYYALRSEINRLEKSNLSSEKLKQLSNEIEKHLVEADGERLRKLKTPDQLYALFLKDKEGKPFEGKAELITKIVSNQEGQKHFNRSILDAFLNNDTAFQEWMSQYFSESTLTGDVFQRALQSPLENVRKRAFERLSKEDLAKIRETLKSAFPVYSGSTLSVPTAKEILTVLSQLSAEQQSQLMNYYQTKESDRLTQLIAASIKAVLTFETNPREREAALGWLEKLDAPEAIPLIKDFLYNPDADRVDWALTLLGKRSSIEASRILREFAKENPKFRQRIEKYLERQNKEFAGLSSEATASQPLGERLRLLFYQRKSQTIPQELDTIFSTHAPYGIVATLIDQMNEYQKVNDPAYRKWLAETFLPRIESQVSSPFYDFHLRLLSDPMDLLREKGMAQLKKLPPEKLAREVLTLFRMGKETKDQPKIENAVIELLSDKSINQHLVYEWEFESMLIDFLSRTKNPAFALKMFPLLKQIPAKQLLSSIPKLAQSALPSVREMARIVLEKAEPEDILLHSRYLNFLEELRKTSQNLKNPDLYRRVTEKVKSKLLSLTASEIDSLQQEEAYVVAFFAEKLAPNSAIDIAMKQSLLSESGRDWLDSLFFHTAKSKAIRNWLFKKMKEDPAISPRVLQAAQVLLATPEAVEALLDSYEPLSSKERVELYSHLIRGWERGMKFGEKEMRLLDRISKLEVTEREQVINNKESGIFFEFMLNSNTHSSPVPWVKVLSENSFLPSESILSSMSKVSPEMQRRIAFILGKRAARGDKPSITLIDRLNLKNHPQLKAFVTPRTCGATLGSLAE